MVLAFLCGAVLLSSCNAKSKVSGGPLNDETPLDTAPKANVLPKPNQMFPSDGGSTQTLSSHSYQVTQVNIGAEKPQGTSKSFQTSGGQEN